MFIRPKLKRDWTSYRSSVTSTKMISKNTFPKKRENKERHYVLSSGNPFSSFRSGGHTRPLLGRSKTLAPLRRYTPNQKEKEKEEKIHKKFDSPFINAPLVSPIFNVTSYIPRSVPFVPFSLSICASPGQPSVGQPDQ